MVCLVRKLEQFLTNMRKCNILQQSAPTVPIKASEPLTGPNPSSAHHDYSFWTSAGVLVLIWEQACVLISKRKRKIWLWNFFWRYFLLAPCRYPMNLGNICNGIQIAGYNLEKYGSFWSDYTECCRDLDEWISTWMREYPLGLICYFQEVLFKTNYLIKINLYLNNCRN